MGCGKSGIGTDSHIKRFARQRYFLMQYRASRVFLSWEIALPGQVRVDWQGFTFAVHAIMAPLLFLGFGWASRLVWAKVVGPTEHNYARCLEVQGPRPNKFKALYTWHHCDGFYEQWAEGE